MTHPTINQMIFPWEIVNNVLEYFSDVTSASHLININNSIKNNNIIIYNYSKLLYLIGVNMIDNEQYMKGIFFLKKSNYYLEKSIQNGFFDVEDFKYIILYNIVRGLIGTDVLTKINEILYYLNLILKNSKDTDLKNKSLNLYIYIDIIKSNNIMNNKQ